jgi:hypothetical protein
MPAMSTEARRRPALKSLQRFFRVPLVSPDSPHRYLPAFIVNFCLKTGPVPARVSPASALRLCSRVMPHPVPGGPALSGLIEITRLAMMQA